MKQKIRSMLVAPPRKLLVACDLSQAETWVVAHLSKDPMMKQALLTSDIHTETASAIFNKLPSAITKEERYTAKRINHASSYRMSPERFTQVYNKDAVELGLPPLSIKTAREYAKVWHSLYLNIKSWWLDIELQLSKAMTLVTPYGRKRVFFQQWGDELFKEATAYIPQSTVADHFNGFVQKELGVEGGLKEFYKATQISKDRYKIIQQGHDSALIEVFKEDAFDMCQVLMSYLKRPLIINGELFTIPVDGEIGENWGNMEKIKL